MVSGVVAGFVALTAYIIVGSFGLPGELLTVLSAGALASGIGQLILIIIVITVASVIGDLATYELARKFSPWLTKQLERWHTYKRNATRVRTMLSKSEFSFVFLTRFLFMSFGSIASYISGFDQLDRRVYVTAIVAGDALYAVIYTTLGFIFKETWTDLNTLIGNVTRGALLLAVVVIIVVWLVRSRKR